MAAVRFRWALRIGIAAGFSTVLLAGCNSAPPALQRADYAATLNRYYEGRPMCLWPESVKFPVQDAAPQDINDRGFAALTDAGLLVRKPASRHAPQGSATFDLSPEGRSAFDRDISEPGAGNFCYGRRKIVSIDRDRQNSPTTELIEYRYNVADPAAWAKEYSIAREFPQVVNELAGPHKAEVTLLDTTEGWEVSGTPAVIPTNKTAPKGSTMAKARVLLGIRKQPS